MAKEEEFYTDYNYELFTDNDNDDEPSTMSECSLFLVQHMIDDECCFVNDSTASY